MIGRGGGLCVVLLAAAGCQQLNPEWCSKPGRCPAGARCDPATNTCVGQSDGGSGDRSGDQPIADQQRRPEARPSDQPRCLGGWICLGGAVGTCPESGPATSIRNCPGGACASGHCKPPVPTKLCTTHQACTTLLWVCTWLIEAGVARQLCAPSVAGAEGAAPCSSGLECSTGLCTAQGRCYHACNGYLDCGPGFECNETTVFVEGITKTTQSCRPQS